ncbi:MAG: DUF1570 domain-containing protein [Erythrobacter sp.]|jgi:tetratricopeptide (TPR) repeat protein
MRFILPLLAAVALATPARAEWHEVQSDHFVVYADDRWQDVKAFSEALERYHSALTVLLSREADIPSPSNRVTIFVVGTESKVRKLVGDGAKDIAGFYIPRAGGSLAFVPSINLSSGETDFSLIVLLHEYAHHFLLSSTRYEMPRWLNEGAAEFFASAKFEKDGHLWVGRPAYHRAGELAYAKDVSVEELLDSDLYAKNHGKSFDAFYGRSWALFHYLYFSDTRKGQLTQYQQAIASGTNPQAAAKQAFGDLEVLQTELDRYLDKRRISAWNLGPDRLPIGEVTIRALREGEAAVMPLRIRSQRGVDHEQALELLPEVRAVAGKYPGDAAVLAALAEAEYDAGNAAEAIAAADRAIAIDPATRNAYRQKGLALFALAADAKDQDKAYAMAMQPFSVLNRLEPDHPFPLIYYYRSFVERGVSPNETARHALERASQLAPFDKDLAMNTALMQASEGKIEIARYTLAPIAADPHGGSFVSRAKRYREAMESVAEGTPWNPGREIEVEDIVAVASDPIDDD